MNKRGSSQQFLKNKKQILEELEGKRDDRVQQKINETPILKLGNIRPEGLITEMKAREIK